MWLKPVRLKGAMPLLHVSLPLTKVSVLVGSFGSACGDHFGGRVSAPFPPAVAKRLLSSALAAAIARPVLNLRR